MAISMGRGVETGLSPHATLVTTGKIDYTPASKCMGQQDVDYHIMPLLVEAES